MKILLLTSLGLLCCAQILNAQNAPNVVAATPLPLPVIIAHRGASHEAPENTIAAARLGFAQGADAVEIDVHLSQDNHIVVMHDANTRRTTGHDAPIVAQTLAQLKTLDAGIWKHPRFKGETVPMLEEIIATVPDGKRLVIEVKCGSEIVPFLKTALQNALQNGYKAEQFVLIGFGYQTICDLKAALPQLETLWLSAFKADENGVIQPTADKLIDHASRAKIEGVNVAAHAVVDAEMIAKTHAAGLKCFAWTVDDAQVARRLQSGRIDGITTNRPAWLRSQISQSN